MNSKVDKYSQILDSLNKMHHSNSSIGSFLSEHRKNHTQVVSDLKTHIEKIGSSVKQKQDDAEERESLDFERAMESPSPSHNKLKSIDMFKESPRMALDDHVSLRTEPRGLERTQFPSFYNSVNFDQTQKISMKSVLSPGKSTKSRMSLASPSKPKTSLIQDDQKSFSRKSAAGKKPSVPSFSVKKKKSKKKKVSKEVEPMEDEKEEAIFEIATENIQIEEKQKKVEKKVMPLRNQSPVVTNLYLPVTFENPYVFKKKSSRKAEIIEENSKPEIQKIEEIQLPKIEKQQSEPSQASSGKPQSEQDSKLPEGPPEPEVKLPESIHAEKFADFYVEVPEPLIEVRLPESVSLKIDAISHSRENSEFKLTQRNEIISEEVAYRTLSSEIREHEVELPKQKVEKEEAPKVDSNISVETPQQDEPSVNNPESPAVITQDQKLPQQEMRQYQNMVPYGMQADPNLNKIQSYHLAVREELMVQTQKSQEYRGRFKTKLCKHFTMHGTCPINEFCQFAHGERELRFANDPLPSDCVNALGPVHSNYKTMPCKNFFERGNCEFAEKCSFFHDESEHRGLTDPLPLQLPEGASLPPMPSKLKIYKENKASGLTYPLPPQQRQFRPKNMQYQQQQNNQQFQQQNQQYHQQYPHHQQQQYEQTVDPYMNQFQVMVINIYNGMNNKNQRRNNNNNYQNQCDQN